jgi:hypothetical protein
MSKISYRLKEKLLTIIKDDYEECQFFMAASHLLTNKIRDITESVQNQNIDFNKLRDNIGEIGVFINNTEKRLEEVEECYTKLVEVLAKEKPKQ